MKQLNIMDNYKIVLTLEVILIITGIYFLIFGYRSARLRKIKNKKIKKIEIDNHV